MGKICKQCGYERKPTDDAPDWACPECEYAYSKSDNADESTKVDSREKLPEKHNDEVFEHRLGNNKKKEKWYSKKLTYLAIIIIIGVIALAAQTTNIFKTHNFQIFEPDISIKRFTDNWLITDYDGLPAHVNNFISIYQIAPLITLGVYNSTDKPIEHLEMYVRIIMGGDSVGYTKKITIAGKNDDLLMPKIIKKVLFLPDTKITPPKTLSEKIIEISYHMYTIYAAYTLAKKIDRIDEYTYYNIYAKKLVTKSLLDGDVIRDKLGKDKEFYRFEVYFRRSPKSKWKLLVTLPVSK